ncbi:hypothetical protein GCM10023080_098760 [Streptomyces pseudoechinosporeus]
MWVRFMGGCGFVVAGRAVPRAPEGARPEPPAIMFTSPHVPAASHRREGPWAGASYARRVGSVSENQDPVPAPGRTPGLRRADAPAHGPDPPTGPQGARGTARPATTHPQPPNRRRHPAGNGATSHNAPAADNKPNPPAR